MSTGNVAVGLKRRNVVDSYVGVVGKSFGGKIFCHVQRNFFYFKMYFLRFYVRP